MIYNVIAIFCSMLIPLILVKEPIKEIFKKEKIKIVFKSYKYEFIFYILVVVGCLVRCFGINLYPNGLNVDEASSTYEAFSILNYGIDRNGNSFPVFLEAWGSGQNALYTYIMIPFVKILGVNIISTRLPMVLISCFSLVVWYKLLEKIKGKKFATIGLAFLVICPWHIMKSRWGLESNIFPDITLYAIFFVVKFLETRKERYLYISFVILGLTAYAYGTSYFFLPLFVIPLLIYLRYKKKIKTSKIFIGVAVIGLISLPIILYVLINTFNLQEIKIGPFTVPKLPVNRYEEQTSLFSGNIIINLLNNFCSQIKLLLTQNDGLIWNNIPGFGMIYIISLPFIIIGLIYDLKEKNNYSIIFRIWLLSALLLLFVLTDANINRINILIIPLIYYAILGIYFLIQNSKMILIVISTIYVFLFIWFEITYFSLKDNGYVFVNDVKDVIEYVDNLEVDEIYFQYAFKEPYIYVLYYTEYNTNDFAKTVEYFDNESLGRFDNIKGFGKYNFYIPGKLDNKKNVGYVIKKDANIDYTGYTVKEFKNYVVMVGEKDGNNKYNKEKI